MTIPLLTPAARSDIATIWFRVAKDSQFIANKVQAAIYSNIDLLGRSPSIGHERPDVTSKPVLVWPALPYRNYLITYTHQDDVVRIVRVIHAAQKRVWRTV